MGGLDQIDSIIYSIVYSALGLFIFTTVKHDASESLADIDAVQGSLKSHMLTTAIYIVSYVTGLGLWLTGFSNLFTNPSLGFSFHALVMVAMLAVCLVVPVTLTNHVFERSVTHLVVEEISETSVDTIQKAA